MQIILPDVAPQPLKLVVSLREVWMTKHANLPKTKPGIILVLASDIIQPHTV